MQQMSTVGVTIQQLCPGCSKNSLRAWLREGRILIDGKPADSLEQPTLGRSISLAPKKKFLSHDVQLLYEDRDLIVVDKPAGLLSVATDHQREQCLHTLLKRHRHPGRVFPVHRLDRETSGILVFACTERARDHLKRQFEAHAIEREYRALVKGIPTPAVGSWRHYVREGADYTVYVTTEHEGRLAITHYEILEQRADRAVLKLRLETGRKNQIRVQAKAMGHPLIGDRRYGSSQGERLCLHATMLAFMHPTREQQMAFSSPAPFRI